MHAPLPDGVVHPVVIIGAGLSGLAIAYELQRRGLSVPVLDAGDRIAESWRSRHPRLRLNTHRRLSWLPGLRMPASAGAFPTRDDVVRYLEAYEWQIARPIQYRTRVARIEPEPDHWRIETSRGAVHAEEVIVATGRERTAHVPDWPGREDFTGALVTAAELGDVEDYAGQRVLVVGAGTSGSDVLNHLVTVETAELQVSVRHGPTVLPTRVCAIPLQLLSPAMKSVPTPVLDVMFQATERLALGNLRRHGLPRPPDGAATRLARDGVGPAFDLGFVDALKAGRIEVVPAVHRFHRNRVELADGSPVYPDVVICATGYGPGLGDMLGHLGVLDERGLPRLVDDSGRTSRTGLRVAGMVPALTGLFTAARGDARRIARQISRHHRRSRHMWTQAPWPGPVRSLERS